MHFSQCLAHSYPSPYIHLSCRTELYQAQSSSYIRLPNHIHTYVEHDRRSIPHLTMSNSSRHIGLYLFHHKVYFGRKEAWRTPM
uniref:Ovule protein n=1 Tax=Ascaris lumbricoides TaxID=6252 RepID=A0A0M3IP19_ASCLU